MELAKKFVAPVLPGAEIDRTGKILSRRSSDTDRMAGGDEITMRQVHLGRKTDVQVVGTVQKSRRSEAIEVRFVEG